MLTICVYMALGVVVSTLGGVSANAQQSRSTWFVRVYAKQLVPPTGALTGDARYTHTETPYEPGIVGVPLGGKIRLGFYMEMSTDHADPNEGFGTGVTAARRQVGLRADQTYLLLTDYWIGIHFGGSAFRSSLIHLPRAWTTRASGINAGRRPTVNFEGYYSATVARVDIILSRHYNTLQTSPPYDTLWCEPESGTNRCEVFIGVADITVAAAHGLSTSSVGKSLTFTVGATNNSDSPPSNPRAHGVDVNLVAKKGNSVSYVICPSTGCPTYVAFDRARYEIEEDSMHGGVPISNEIGVGIRLHKRIQQSMDVPITVPVQIAVGTAPANSYRISYLGRPYPSETTINLTFPTGDDGGREIVLTTVPDEVDIAGADEERTVIFRFGQLPSAVISYDGGQSVVSIVDNEFPEAVLNFAVVGGESEAVEGAQGDNRLRVRGTLDLVSPSEATPERRLFALVAWDFPRPVSPRNTADRGDVNIIWLYRRSSGREQQIPISSPSSTWMIFESDATGDYLGHTFIVEAVSDNVMESGEHIRFRFLNSKLPSGITLGSEAIVNLADPNPNTVTLSALPVSFSESEHRTNALSQATITITGVLDVWDDTSLKKSTTITLDALPPPNPETDPRTFAVKGVDYNIRTPLPTMTFPTGSRDDSVPQTATVTFTSRLNRKVEEDKVIRLGGSGVGGEIVVPVEIIIEEADVGRIRIRSPADPVPEGEAAEFTIRPLDATIYADVTISWAVATADTSQVAVPVGQMILSDPLVRDQDYHLSIGVADDELLEDTVTVDVHFSLQSVLSDNIRISKGGSLRNIEIPPSDLVQVHIDGPTEIREGQPTRFTIVTSSSRHTESFDVQIELASNDDVTKYRIKQGDIGPIRFAQLADLKLEAGTSRLPMFNIPIVNSNESLTDGQVIEFFLTAIQERGENDVVEQTREFRETLGLSLSVTSIPNEAEARDELKLLHIVETSKASIQWQTGHGVLTEGVAATFVVELDSLPDRDISIEWDIDYPAAVPTARRVAMNDFSLPNSRLLTFRPGDASKMQTVNITADSDNMSELEESFRLTISVPAADSDFAVVDDKRSGVDGVIAAHDHVVVNLYSYVDGGKGDVPFRSEVVQKQNAVVEYIIKLADSSGASYEAIEAISFSFDVGAGSTGTVSTDLADAKPTIDFGTFPPVRIAVGESSVRFTVSIEPPTNDEKEDEVLRFSISESMEKTGAGMNAALMIGSKNSMVTTLKLPRISLKATPSATLPHQTAVSIKVEPKFADTSTRVGPITLNLWAGPLSVPPSSQSIPCFSSVEITIPLSATDLKQTVGCQAAHLPRFSTVPALRIWGEAGGFVVEETSTTLLSGRVVLAVSPRRVVEGGPTRDIKLTASFEGQLPTGLMTDDATDVTISLTGPSGLDLGRFTSFGSVTLSLTPTGTGKAVHFFPIDLPANSIDASTNLTVAGLSDHYNVVGTTMSLRNGLKLSGDFSTKFISLGKATDGSIGWSGKSSTYVGGGISSITFELDGVLHSIEEISFDPSTHALAYSFGENIPADVQNLELTLDSEILNFSDATQAKGEFTWTDSSLRFGASEDYIPLILSRLDAMTAWTQSTIADQTWFRRHTVVSLTLPAVTGGNLPITYRISPELPPGLSFDPDGSGSCQTARQICGTPAGFENLGNTSYTFTAEDRSVAGTTNARTLMFDAKLKSVLDINGDGRVTGADPSIIHLTFSLASVLGDGTAANPGFSSFRRAVLAEHVNPAVTNPTDEHLRSLIVLARNLSPYRALLDINRDNLVNNDDALLLLHAITLVDQIGDGVTGGSVASRSKRIRPYVSPSVANSDEDYRELIYEMRRFVQ